LDDLFSVPTPPEDRLNYSVGQLFSDAARKHGLSGIQYRSSVGAGVNIVFFDPGALEYADGSGSVRYVEETRHTTSVVLQMGHDDDYMMDNLGNFL
jgi:RES domain-containing protein